MANFLSEHRKYLAACEIFLIAVLQNHLDKVLSDVPKIRKFSFPDNILENDVVSVACFAMAKVKPITFQWLKNDKELSEFQENMRFDTGSEISALIIDPVKLTDSGNYTCATSNADGSDRFTAMLSVKASPKWINEPNNITTIMGASIEARCTASGSPEPQMSWKKKQDAKNVPMTTHRQWSPGQNSSSLKISPVTYDHAGVYECSADNGISPSIITSFTLSVRDPPKVKQFRFDDNIKEGDVASVMCLVTSGSKPVKFQWNKNGSPVSVSNSDVRIDDGAIHSVLVFDSVKLSDDANYTCVAMNSEGQDSFTAELNVKADGNEFIDVKPPPGSEKDFNSGVFSLPSVSESDSGFYECIANNGIEPSVKSNFSIVIHDIPNIQAFSFPESVIEGNMVSVLCVAATKVKPITFQWLKNNKEISALEENIRITSANDVSVLIVDPVTLEHSGNYTCSATNSEGSDRFTAALNVKASPKWLEQPTDVITTVGAPVHVRCLASGSPEPIIQWIKKDGSKIVNSNIEASKDTKNSSILRIPHVSYEDAGVYECIADNGIPLAITSNFTLTIRDAPEIQKFSFQDDILEGKRVSVTCLVASNSKAVSFNWYKNGKEISSSETNLKITNGNEFSLLILDPVSLEDNANYTCKATNVHGSDKHTAFLNVKAPPKWLETPKDVIATIGDSVIITCDASGSPRPRIYWKKLLDKRNASIQTSLREHASNESANQLKLPSISYEDAGVYECIADNGISNKIRSNFSVIVRERPIIERFQFKDNIKEGDFVSVVCLVKSGTQPINLIWYRNGDDIKILNKGISIENSPVISALILNSVSSDNDGNYTCVAKNNFGSDHHSALLKVRASPKWIEHPENVVAVIGDSINVKCIASGSPPPNIQWRKLPESPVIKKFQFEENVKEGDFVSVVCLVKSGTQPITFMWYKNGEEFKTSNKDGSIENSPITSALVLNSVTSQSDGNYTCTAKNKFGSDSHSTTLKVKGKLHSFLK
ncbi:Titin [Araneus ventricosus]|uniref:Titin n=1 Tax=Araneus ventricosus TaxID=182803 RepID=A0A4Y2AAY4_ARAVE|nr:Titin [Araneus ventricosus]